MENSTQLGNYILTCKLGEGSYGGVFRAFHKTTKKIVAIKIMDKTEIAKNDLWTKVCNEELFYKKLNHKNIIKYVETLHNKEYHCFVLEYCNAHNLKEFCDFYLLRCYHIPQKLIQHFMRQICDGVSYMHKHKCIHRDLKQENIMVTFHDEEKIQNSFIEVSDIEPMKLTSENVELIPVNLTESLMKMEIKERQKQNFYEKIQDKKEFERVCLNSRIKIIDLGFARGFDENRPKSFCGNAHSAPPELLQGNEINNIQFDYKFDIWGIGAIAYKIMTQHPPFDSNPDMLLDFQKRSAYKLPLDIHTSVELIDFIDKLLILNPEERMNWANIIEHPFLNEDSDNFTIIHLEIKGSYDPLVVNNQGMTLVDVLDKYKKRDLEKGVTLREFIKKKLEYAKTTDKSQFSVDVNMDDVMSIQNNNQKNKFLSDYIKEDYLDYLYSDSYLFNNNFKF